VKISDYMSKEHRECDVEFANAEKAVESGDFALAKSSFETFMIDTLAHFNKEEQILFPAFESASGNAQGPTAVMKMEHEQARGLFEKMKSALDAEDSDSFFAVSDTFMILLQQHNMKEEQMLYSMCDRFLADSADKLVERMRA